MYKILSLPSEVEGADRMIKASENIAAPPDFEDLFIDRRYQYSLLGLLACKLSEELCEKYDVPKKTYNDWNPIEFFKSEGIAFTTKRHKRMKNHKDFVERILGGN